jgi:hypothetical protein
LEVLSVRIQEFSDVQFFGSFEFFEV